VAGPDTTPRKKRVRGRKGVRYYARGQYSDVSR
jgi:hypothetical protein